MKLTLELQMLLLAVRFESPIYTYEFVLKSAGIILDDEELSNDEISTEINLEEITKTQRKINIG